MRRLAGAVALSVLLPVSVMASPAALVLDVSGSIEPPVALFDEVDDGTVLHLDAGATLTLSHYASCQEVALEGGTVSVGAEKLVVEGGRVLTLATVACPDRIDLAGAEQVNMGVALRAITSARIMAPAPEFVLVGAWGRQFDTIDVTDGDGTVTTLAVTDGRAAWPEDQAPLATGTSYHVVLHGPDAPPRTIEIDVTEGPIGMTVLTGR